MTLLRISEFCRSGHSGPTAVSVEIATSRPATRNNSLGSCCAVGLVTADVLFALSRHQGTFAWLSHGPRRVLLRLHLYDSAPDDSDSYSDNSHSREGMDALSILVPPVVAANLNIFSKQMTTSMLEITDESPKHASLVILRPYGCEPKWPRLGNSRETEDWIFPRPYIIVQEGHVISVFDSSDGRICYYDVLKVECDDNNETHSSDGSSYQLSRLTEFQLDKTRLEGDCYVRRLPCLISQRRYYETTTTTMANSKLLPPHPDLAALTRVFQGASPTSRPAERILHVLGSNEEHDLCLAVETAARHAGRTCWSLRGLAAFAHSVGRTVRSGSLIDQLAGLEAVLEEIQQQRMEPSVLHLYDVNDELSSVDEQVRRDQEERIWTKLVQAVEKKPLQPPVLESVQSGQSMDLSAHRFTCPLMVVLSTATPLKSGPWMENLMLPSICLSLPDDGYRSFLMDGAKLNDATMELLKGRNAQEICRIKNEIISLNDPEEACRVVERLSDEDDLRRRKQRSAAVAQIRWEDVGGIDHVRNEIMNAIELPLKHPHLFPRGRGRSGILLYGPPGTGKTLVAKAVATECGLPFLSIKGPELLGSYVGESEANVRKVFQSAREAAKQNTPISACILFFDELDSLAPKRGGVGDGGGVMERVVATLLAEMDGDATSSDCSARVFVMSATNRPDLVDPSLLRPGRLDRSVYMGIASDPTERYKILAAQLRKLKLHGDPSDLAKQVVPKLPPILTGADFSTIASGALLQATERLCRKADEEQLAASKGKQEEIEMQEILQGWDAEKCTPIVRLEDLLEAAKFVSPSVTQEELDRYERLKEEYSVNVPNPIEHEGDVYY